jgi:hypothetical protein
MTNLRKLVVLSFIAGMLFDSFISAITLNHFGTATLFILATIFELWGVLKLYDKVKVNK